MPLGVRSRMRLPASSRTVPGQWRSEKSMAAGRPWAASLRGALEQLVVESELLADNPLGDPARRPLYVYRSPGRGALTRPSGSRRSICSRGSPGSSTPGWRAGPSS